MAIPDWPERTADISEIGIDVLVDGAMMQGLSAAAT